VWFLRSLSSAVIKFNGHWAKISDLLNLFPCWVKIE